MLTSVMDRVVFGQELLFARVLGIALIVTGTVWLNLSLPGTASGGEEDDEA